MKFWHMAPDVRSVHKLLIYRFGQIGDTVVSLPALWLLRESFPRAEFTLLSEAPLGDAAIPPDQVLPSEGIIQRYLKYQDTAAVGRMSAMLRMILALRRERFDALAYLLPTIRSKRRRARDAFFFKLAGIKHFLGFEGYPDDSFPRRDDGSLMPVPHEADALLHRLARSGLSAIPAGKGRMDLSLTKVEDEHADAWWQRQAMPDHHTRPWFAVCSGSKWSSKQWPAQNFLEIGRKLMNQHGLLPVIFGGREDRAAGKRLISDWGGGLCAAGELSVRESAALLRHARFYLGNDTGVMHLAAAVGTPCVAIFSALDWPGRWYPYGEGHQVLRHEVACAGCLSPVCDHQHHCLTGVSADSVYQACCKALRCPPSPV